MTKICFSDVLNHLENWDSADLKTLTMTLDLLEKLDIEVDKIKN